MRSNTFTVIELRSRLMKCTDPRADNSMRFILSGSGFGVSDSSWTPEARTGRYFWDLAERNIRPNLPLPPDAWPLISTNALG